MPIKPKPLPQGTSIMRLQDITYILRNPKTKRLYHYKNKALVWNPNELHELFFKPIRESAQT